MYFCYSQVHLLINKAKFKAETAVNLYIKLKEMLKTGIHIAGTHTIMLHAAKELKEQVVRSLVLGKSLLKIYHLGVEGWV